MKRHRNVSFVLIFSLKKLFKFLLLFSLLVCRTTSLSDSETDSDVLFETRTKPNGILRNTAKNTKHNSHGQNKYTITKLGRKVKT